jgi:beta-phosphoglucomutase-like phosphatase (HAD superfamily)
VIGNEDVENKKPHPEGLELAMRRLGKNHKNCCYVGDCPIDIIMGKHAGVLTIGIPGEYPASKSLRDAFPDLWFDSLPQFCESFGLLKTAEA